MKRILVIENTLELLCTCWNDAETALQKDIENNSPDIDEELITHLFQIKLTEKLRTVSDNRAIENAFLKDLKAFFSKLNYGNKLDFARIARGLVADVTWHRRNTEKLTGGDLGILIIRPQIYFGNLLCILIITGVGFSRRLN